METNEQLLERLRFRFSTWEDKSDYWRELYAWYSACGLRDGDLAFAEYALVACLN